MNEIAAIAVIITIHDPTNQLGTFVVNGEWVCSPSDL